ncbi:AAA family ATPase [Methanobrevibacter sp.]|uniref:AAA family ATPase n=1 Tax=Methanobrevibacter sp. TaxID=66852 RepID=UPI003890F57D
MIFKKLELKNFKSHANTTIDFNTGITLIVGENGAGKSSIFEAITFALFKQSDLNNADLVRTNKGISSKIEMEVKLTFNSHGVDYRVERKVKKNNDKVKSSARLIRITDLGEEIISTKIKEVDHEIEVILSMDSSTFLNAIHVRQGQISDLIDKQPAERKKLIGQLLKLDDLENAYKRIPEITNERKSQRDVLSGKIVNEVELNDQLNTITKEHDDLLQKDITLKENLKEIKSNLDEKTRKKEDLDLLKEKFTKLNLEKTHQDENLFKLNQTKEKLDSELNNILENEKQMEILKPYCEQLENSRKFKESYILYNGLKKDHLAKTEIINKITSNNEILITEKEAHDKYIELNDDIGQLKIQETELTSELKLAGDLKNRKNTISDEITQMNQKLDSFFNKTNEILKDYELEFSELKELNVNVSSLIKTKEDEITKIDTELKGFNDEKVRLAQQSDSLTEPLDDIRKVENKCPTCQSEISEAKKEELINYYEGTISSNSQRIEELSKLIEDSNNKKDTVKANLDDLKSIINETKQMEIYTGQITKSNGELEAINLQINQTQEKRQKLEELQVVLQSKLEEFNSLKSHYDEYVKAQTIISSLEDEDKLKAELESINNNIKDTKKELENFISIDSALSLEITEDELNRKIGELTKKDAQYKFLTGSVNRKEEVENTIKTNGEEIASKTAEIEGIQKTIDSCEYDEKTHEELNLSVEDLTKKFNSLDANIKVNETLIKTNEEKITEIRAKISENNNHIKQYDALNDYIDLLDDFRWHYSKDGIQKELRAQSKPLIQKYTRDFFEKFNFNYSDLVLDDDYNISIFGPEGEVKLDMVSGGEEIAIALSLRLGITQVMSKGMIETILLDEPTIHLDSYRKQELIEVLRSMKVIPQMIIVTHDAELEAAASNLIKVKKEDGISKVENN